MKLLNGNVLVKPLMRNNRILLQNGKELYLDTSFNQGEHSEIVCEVKALPAEKTKKMEKLAGDWECDIDIQVGDIAYCDYRFINLSIDGPGQFIVDGEKYYSINSKHIFCVKRSKKIERFTFKDGGKSFELIDEIIMLNGYVLLEPYKNDRIWFTEEGKAIYRQLQIGIEVPRYIKDKVDNRMGIVRYIGKPNKRYQTAKSKWVDSDDIKAGDIVVFLPERDIFLEYEFHASLEGKKKFYRVQNHDIIMKIEF